MTSRPILFSGAMVRAILDDSKTQTRRVCKATTQNHADIIAGALMDDIMGDDDGTHEKAAWERIGCPHGQPGDRLWVRETVGRRPASFMGVEATNGVESAYYKADGEDVVDDRGFNLCPWWSGPVCVSIHMPRWACRITLEIVFVRVERLQDISEEDAEAEGIDRSRSMDVFYHHGKLATSRAREEAGIPEDAPYGPRAWYAELWESINGPGSWDANPYVWVVEFRRVQP